MDDGYRYYVTLQIGDKYYDYEFGSEAEWENILRWETYPVKKYKGVRKPINTGDFIKLLDNYRVKDENKWNNRNSTQ